MPPLDIVDVAPLQGSKQQGAPHWLTFAAHRFSAGADGQLEHFTDGQLRARVPPQAWTEYARLWPAARPLIEQLRKPAKARK